MSEKARRSAPRARSAAAPGLPGIMLGRETILSRFALQTLNEPPAPMEITLPEADEHAPEDLTLEASFL